MKTEESSNVNFFLRVKSESIELNKPSEDSLNNATAMSDLIFDPNDKNLFMRGTQQFLNDIKLLIVNKFYFTKIIRWL